MEGSERGIETRTGPGSIGRIIEAAKKEEITLIATLDDPYCAPCHIAKEEWFDETVEMYPFRRNDLYMIVRDLMIRYPVECSMYVPEVMRIMEGRSMAEITGVFELAMTYVIYEERDALNFSDIVRAALKCFFGLPYDDGRSKDKILERIAVHEAGHIITSEILEPESVIFSTISSVPGTAAGHTLRQKPYDFDYDPKLMENRIVNLLGGKAATEIVYGYPDTGSGHDIEEATELIEILLNNAATGSFALRRHSGMSERSVRKIDAEIASYLNDCYCEAMEIIADNREVFDLLVAGVLDKKTLTARDIRGIIKI